MKPGLIFFFRDGNVGLSVGVTTSLVENEISQQVLNGFD